MCFSSLVVWWDVISYKDRWNVDFFFPMLGLVIITVRNFPLSLVHVYLALWVQNIWKLQGAGVQWLRERKPTDICYEQLIPGIMAFQHFLIWGPWKMLGVQCTAEHFKSANNTLPFPLAFFKQRGWGACPDYISVPRWKQGTFPQSWLVCFLLCLGFSCEEVSGADLEVGSDVIWSGPRFGISRHLVSARIHSCVCILCTSYTAVVILGGLCMLILDTWNSFGNIFRELFK